MFRNHRATQACISVALLAITARGLDLGDAYPATLVPSDKPVGYAWTCGDGDVWRLKSCTIELDDQFKLKCGACQVVIGHHKGNALWAAILPEKPGQIIRSEHGQGESVSSVWLRFHPSRIGALFPEDDVIEIGDETNVPKAKAIAAHKLRSSYHAGGRPMVPPLNHLIVDCETSEGNRRFFLLDTDAQTVRYVDAFRRRTMPAGNALTEDVAVDVFDRVWSAFDREYAMFVVKPHVNWQKLREQFRPQAAKANDNRELAATISEMLSHLEDLHVFVKVDGQVLDGYTRQRPLNASAAATESLIGKLTDGGRHLQWVISEDQIGYIRVDGLVDNMLPVHFETAVRRMKGTRGLVLDLRYNGGGSEGLAKKIASLFLDEPRVYAKSQLRTGARHEDLSKEIERRFEPHPRWHYSGPVVALQGQKTMSSAEAMTLMMGQCPNVTTLGDRTAGSSANPRQLEAGVGIVVNLPRWNPLTADGKPFDTVGVAPDVLITATADDFTGTEDPVLTAAIKHLRSLEKPKGPVLNKRQRRDSPLLSDEVSQLWKRVIEANRHWLEPHPKRLRYQLAGKVEVDQYKSEMINRVWIDHDRARWELAVSGSDNESLQLALVIDGVQEQYVESNDPKRLTGPRPARNWSNLKQGIIFHTATHWLYQQGMPGNCRIAERRKDGDHEIVVLEADVDQASSRIGMGLFHVTYGSAAGRFNRVRLHIQLPQHVPVLEELSWQKDRSTLIQYGRSYHKVRGGYAPKRVTHRQQLQHGRDDQTIEWNLTATFQIIDEIWLLKNARNTQDDKPVASLTVTDVSTEPIAEKMFALPDSDR